MTIEVVPGTSIKYYLLALSAQGQEQDEPEGKLSQKIGELLAEKPITDVFLVNLGWLGDITVARRQYNRWIKAMVESRSAQPW